MGHPRPLFRVFQIFKKHYNFTTNTCEKCPSSIQYWDLNPQPSGHESLPITTRPGLRPKVGVESLPETLLWNGQRKPSLLSDSKAKSNDKMHLRCQLQLCHLSLYLCPCDFFFLSIIRSFSLFLSFFLSLSSVWGCTASSWPPPIRAGTWNASSPWLLVLPRCGYGNWLTFEWFWAQILILDTRLTHTRDLVANTGC